MPIPCPDCGKQVFIDHSYQRGWIDIYVCSCGCEIRVVHPVATIQEKHSKKEKTK